MKTRNRPGFIVGLAALLLAGCGVVTLGEPPRTTEPEVRTRSPEPMRKVRPQMPRDAWRFLSRGEVVVTMDFIVTEEGKVRDARVTSVMQDGSPIKDWRMPDPPTPEMSVEARIRREEARVFADRAQRALAEVPIAAKIALEQWTFKPALLDGKPVEYRMTFPFSFLMD